MKRISSLLLALLLLITLPLSASAAGYSDEDTTTVKNIINKNFTNETVIAPLWKLDNIGSPTTAKLKSDWSDFDTENLVFYNFNLENKKLSIIKEPDYSIDSENRITFSTDENQGFVVISNGVLSKEKTPTKKATPSTKKSLDTVFWVDGGKVYHSTKECASLKRSSNIRSGTIAQSRRSRRCKLC